MSMDILCATCGTDEHLRGSPRDDDTIELTCEQCGTSWIRDPRPACPKCGSQEMEAAPKVIIEKSRGSQMSIQGIQREFLCRTCDADEIRATRDGHLPGRLPGSQ
jgi:DNA-directed RNA polymerase subunit RPC12/RpoP